MDDVKKPETGNILEIAIVLTDKWLRVKDSLNLIPHVRTEDLKLSDWSAKEHEKSGLMRDVLASTVSIAEVDTLCCDFLNGHVRPNFTFYLCGSTITSDRLFIMHHMPKLYARLHYRQIDVTSLELIVNMTMPHMHSNFPQKRLPEHRAMPDILSSIDLMRFFYSSVLDNWGNQQRHRQHRRVRQHHPLQNQNGNLQAHPTTSVNTPYRARYDRSLQDPEAPAASPLPPPPQPRAHASTSTSNTSITKAKRKNWGSRSHSFPSHFNPPFSNNNNNKNNNWSQKSV